MKSKIATLAIMSLLMIGCTNAEMAQVQEATQEVAQDNADMYQMETACKNYMAFQRMSDLPMAAFSVSAGFGQNGSYTIPVDVQWDEPRVEESGNCIIRNGVVVNYIRN